MGFAHASNGSGGDVARSLGAYNRDTVDADELLRVGKAVALGLVLGAVLSLLARVRPESAED